MSPLPPEEIQAIIGRVRERLGEHADGAGVALRGQEALSREARDELGDGVHGSVDQAVQAAGRAFDAFRAAGLEARTEAMMRLRTSSPRRPPATRA